MGDARPGDGAGMTRTHVLKTWPEPFAAILRGDKRHEVRVNDRDYAYGDVLVLREYDPTPIFDGTFSNARGYTGREVRAHVTHLTLDWGLPANLCVMSIEVKP